MNTCTHPLASTSHRLGHAAGLGLAAIGIGLLALADNLHLTEMRLLHTFWPLALALLGLDRLLGGAQRGLRAGSLALIVVGCALTAARLGMLAPLQLGRWWPLLPILAGAVLLWKGRGRQG